MARTSRSPPSRTARRNLATTAPIYSDDTFGGAKFDLTHYANKYGVPDSEYDRIVGDEAKTKSFAADKMLAVTEDHENEWGNQINGAQVGFTRTQMGSWLHAVSDGVSTGEAAYKVYGLIDRSDAGNADFRGVVNVKNGTLTLSDIVSTRNLTRKNGGKVDLLLAETTIYSALESKLMNTQVVVTYDEKWSQFGGQFWRFAGMVGVMEHRMPTGVLGGLDTSTWAFWMDDKKPFSGDRTMIVDPSIAGGPGDPAALLDPAPVQQAEQQLQDHRHHRRGVIVGSGEIRLSTLDDSSHPCLPQPEIPTPQ